MGVKWGKMCDDSLIYSIVGRILGRLDDLVGIDFERGDKLGIEANAERSLALADGIALAVENIHALAVFFDLLGYRLANLVEARHVSTKCTFEDEHLVADLILGLLDRDEPISLAQRLELSHLNIGDGLWPMAGAVVEETDDVLGDAAMEQWVAIVEDSVHEDETGGLHLLLPHHTVGILDMHALEGDEALHQHLFGVDGDEEVLLLGFATTLAFLCVDAHQIIVNLHLMAGMHKHGKPSKGRIVLLLGHACQFSGIVEFLKSGEDLFGFVIFVFFAHIKSVIKGSW